ncbi:hypothetical protein [Verminephrobacter eiseniae]|uniref:hypothetical protein n=1 Tax=Verminephrobacter eiseniae TaxID=364317 RepID=UPI0022380ADB|nr:hypothetical protein [Verminephrobacter eiseniae]
MNLRHLRIGKSIHPQIDADDMASTVIHAVLDIEAFLRSRPVFVIAEGFVF